MLDPIRDILDYELLSPATNGDITHPALTVEDFGVAFFAILVGFVLGRLVEALLRKLQQKTPDDTIREQFWWALEAPMGWLFRIGGIWLALREMPLGKIHLFDVEKFVEHLMQAVTVALATWLATRLVQRLTDLWSVRAATTEGTFDDQLVPVVRKTTKAVLVAVGAVMIVQNLGYSVGSLLAGIGLGGAALAFASKDTVANFFGSIVIFVDRPFQIGDWIEVGDVEGTVEEVGLRVTRIRTFANSVITIPNAHFTTDAINNWSRMKKRRIKLTLGLTYSTRPDQMRQAVQAIRDIIRGDDRLHQDFFLVNFFDYGPSSLDIFCYVFTRTTNWAEHMQIREDFMLKVMEAMQGLGLSFAFPSRSLYLESLPTDLQLPSRRASANTEPPGAPKAMLRDTPL